jgi:hypothetical protein
MLDKRIGLAIILTILTINSITSVNREAAMVKRKNPRIYKTKEICDRFDISRATLFRWESEGLLSGVGRDWRGWRIYNENNLTVIEKIIRGKSA